MKVGFIQFNPIFGEIERNLNKTVELIKKNLTADLLVLPELCITGYLFEEKVELQRLAEPIPQSDTIKSWIHILKDSNTFIVAGVCEKETEKKFYNTAVILGPKGFIGKYRKIHLFNTEKNFFTPGKGPLEVFTIGKTRIGVIICFDWAFPEITRILALKGAEIICHPANLVLNYAQQTMLARSVENGVFTITANRIGKDIRKKSQIAFTGKSQITSPQMEILVRAQEDVEESRVIDIDPTKAQNKMITSNNHLFLDRQITLYKDILCSNRNKKAI